MTNKEFELQGKIDWMRETIDQKNREIKRLNARIMEMLELIDKINEGLDKLKG